MSPVRHKKINTYKLRRLFKKRIYRLQNSVDSTFFSSGSRKKDFAWGGQYANPHVARRSAANYEFKFKLALFIGLSLTTLGLATFHPRFQLNSVDVGGLVRIEKNDIVGTALAAMDGRQFFTIPRSNYFFFDLEELKSVLVEKFPIEHIAITKKFPGNLSIVVEEKISNIIYDNGKQYAYVDMQGNVVEIKRNVLDTEWAVTKKMVTSSGEGNVEVSKEEIINRTHKPDVSAVSRELGNLPILYDARATDMAINTKILRDATAAAVVSWYNILDKRINVPISYFEIGDELGDVLMHTKNGWSIKGRLTEIEDQSDALNTILKEKISGSNIQYIDVRYEGRVYWK